MLASQLMLSTASFLYGSASLGKLQATGLSVLVANTEVAQHGLGEPLSGRAVGRPGIAALLVQALLDIEDRPLPRAVEFVQLVTLDRHRNRQPRPRPHRVGGHRAGTALVAQVIDEHLADPVLRSHLRDEAI